MNFFGRLLVSFSVVTIIIALVVKAEEERECVKRLVDTCKSTDYSQYGGGSSYIITTTDITPSGELVHISCVRDVRGTRCHLDNSPWFSCSPNRSAFYKGERLSMRSADDEICFTAEKLANGSPGNIFDLTDAQLKENERKLKKQMDDLHDRLDKMNDDLKKKFRSCFPFCDNNPFGKGFPFNR